MFSLCLCTNRVCVNKNYGASIRLLLIGCLGLGESFSCAVGQWNHKTGVEGILLVHGPRGPPNPLT